MWIKVLKKPVMAEHVPSILGLTGFRVSEDGIVYRAVRYIKIFDDRLVMERIRGASLGSILRRSGNLRASARQRQEAQVATCHAGRWLKHFHSAMLGGPVERFDLAARLDQSRLYLRELAAHGLDRDLTQKTEQRLARAVSLSLAQTVTSIHGDFKPDNLMIVPGEVIGIDMEGLHRGHPLIDLGQFLVHLFLSRSSAFLGTGSPLWWQRLEDEFLRGYGDDAGLLEGLDFRLVETLLAISSRLLNRRGPVFWHLRGLPLLAGTLRHFLDNPVKRGP